HLSSRRRRQLGSDGTFSLSSPPSHPLYRTGLGWRFAFARPRARIDLVTDPTSFLRCEHCVPNLSFRD
uniref:Uncharacterized protein n=1 Tax=Aegilops tauschii subsp. strangulata TaxID=200361 RepID=A0A453NLE3_AEGTS